MGTVRGRVEESELHSRSNGGGDSFSAPFTGDVDDDGGASW